MKELFATELEHLSLKRLVYGLGPLVSYLKKKNVDVAPLFQAADLEQGATSDPAAYMSLEQELRFTQAAIKALDDPSLGLRVGSLYHLSAYGPLGLAMMSSNNLAEGLRTSVVYNSLTWTRLRWALCLDRDSAVLQATEVEYMEGNSLYMIERDFSAVLKMCQEMLGGEFQLQSAQIAYPKPVYAERYNEVFACPVEFDADVSALVIESRWLDQALPQANADVWRVSCALCSDLVERLTRDSSYAEMIGYLMLDGTGNFLSLEAVAAKLHTSSRTLRRKLVKEGTSFQELLTRARTTLATELLSGGRLSTDQVAERLGYSDSAAFCHAFKRWTGKPPRCYR